MTSFSPFSFSISTVDTLEDHLLRMRNLLAKTTFERDIFARKAITLQNKRRLIGSNPMLWRICTVLASRTSSKQWRLSWLSRWILLPLCYISVCPFYYLGQEWWEVQQHWRRVEPPGTSPPDYLAWLSIAKYARSRQYSPIIFFGLWTWLSRCRKLTSSQRNWLWYKL